MPEISRFYGLIIKMYFRVAEHNPPHFHVICGDTAGIFDIESLKMLEGDLPSKAQSLVSEWASKHKDELLNIWNTQNFQAIEPLK